MKYDGVDGRAKGAPLSGNVDDRVTRVGKRLRSYHLDELPQLYNVVRGDMTLLGPRPETPEFVDLDDERWRSVLAFPPGIAGPTQVIVNDWERELIDVGTGGLTYRDTVLPVKLAIDSWYLRRSSPINDALVAVTLLRRFMPGTESWTLKKRVFGEVAEADVVHQYLKERRNRRHWEPQEAPSSADFDSRTFRPIPNDFVMSTELDGETVIYDTLYERVHLFNFTATMVWNRCTGSATVEQIAADIVRELGTDPDAVTGDVASLIAELVELGLVSDASGTRFEPARAAFVDPPLALSPLPQALRSPAHVAGPFRALDLCFDVLTNDEVLAATVEATFSSLRTDAEDLPPNHFAVIREASSSLASSYTVAFNDEILFKMPGREGLLSMLATYVNREAGSASSRFVLVHGAAVQTGGGIAVIPGASGAGKSTLAAALLINGCGYLTDELAAIDPVSLEINPYPRPLSLSHDGPILATRPSLVSDAAQLLCTDLVPVPPSSLSAHGIGSKGPARLIVVPDRQMHGPVSFETISTSEALSLLAANTLNMSDHGVEGLEALSKVADGSLVVRLTYADVFEAAAIIQSILASDQLGVSSRGSA